MHHDADAVRRVRGAHVLYDRRAGGPPRFAAVLSSHLFKAGIARRRTNGGLLASDARGLAVLNPKYNPVPQRVLLEIAVLSNPEDRTLALSRQWRWQAAHRIAEAIFACENGEGAH